MMSWAASCDVLSAGTSSIGFTSTRSKPMTSRPPAMANSVCRSSSYVSPLTSDDAQPGTSGTVYIKVYREVPVSTCNNAYTLTVSG